MSLFKTRTFWSVNSEEDEGFDQNSLIVSKLDEESDFIVSGSHAGILRIFKPSSQLNENNNLTDYKPTDLVVEKNFNGPVLQVAVGRLVSGSQKRQLAILQPRSFSVYSLVTKEGATEHGTQNFLQLHYEQSLRRLASCFVLGAFGGSHNRDFTCIQSLDGLLTFFEQESFVFCCFLPEFLLPSPIVFHRRSDSFITCSSSWHVTSFKYKMLSEAGQNSVEDDDSGKRIDSDWNFNLGEGVIDILPVQDNIMILGERNLFCLSHTGRLKFMKRLDFSPICFTSYLLNEQVMSLVVSETSTLLVYQNVSLKWSAQLHLLPVCIKRAFLHNISGVLVLLSEEGRLECSYLGTTPSLFSAPPLTSQDLDFDKAGLELATLHKIIKNSYANDIKVTNASAERELAINISVSPHLEPCNIKNVINNQMCKISIDVLPQALFEEVQLAFHVQPPLKIQPQVEFFNNLSDRTSIDCYVLVDGCNLVGSLIIRVVASFISNLGVPRSVTKCSMLPLSLVAETCPPLKESEHKVTLTINQSPTILATLFPEFGGLNSFTTGSNAIGFKRFSDEGTVVTVMLAKNSERYRLQSDSLAALSLLIQQMVYRLKRHYNKSDFAVGFSSSLPANEVVPYVQQHFEARQKYNALQNDLSQLSAQFRLIQKRLIAKFKVKNPAPLSNLELLLEDTSAQIMKLSESLENGVENLRKAQDELSCALSVISNLIELMEVKNTGLELIKATFSQFIYDLQGQNWEDVTDASLCYLLRTVLAKSEKDKLRAAHTSFDEVKDITKLEKRITQVLERFSKEGILETHFPVNATENKKTKEEASIPIGSKIGESSSRLLSARKGFMRKRLQVEESHNST